MRTSDLPDPRLDDITAGQRAIYALTWIRAEVGNGGFDQLFRNTTGCLLPDAVEGAELVGSEPWHSLLAEAMNLLPRPYPRDRGQRLAVLDTLPESTSEAMSGLDDRFYALVSDSATDLTAIGLPYIEAHPEEFYLDP